MKDRHGHDGHDFRINNPPNRWANRDAGSERFDGHPPSENTIKLTEAFRKRLKSGRPAGDAPPPLRRPGLRKS
ncbi:MAG TPA: hypothetical protein VM077_02875 [Candidatus Limnocylindrales bacterium]|nr:hypothetical protein [Candidatus Limnocylindrales bacterium]